MPEFFSTSVTSAPFCETSIDEFPITGNHIKLFPNPSELYFRIESDFIIQGIFNFRFKRKKNNTGKD
jgi:hypothetical protein